MANTGLSRPRATGTAVLGTRRTQRPEAVTDVLANDFFCSAVCIVLFHPLHRSCCRLVAQVALGHATPKRDKPRRNSRSGREQDFFSSLCDLQ